MIHFAITPDHFAEAAGQGLFFLILGTLQIGWALWHLGRPSLRVWLSGIAISTASLVVYLLSLFVEAPFSSGTENIDYLALFTKVTEVVTMGLLAWPLVSDAPTLGRPRAKMATLVVLVFMVGIVGAGASYGVGYGLELVAPSLSDPSEHHHGDDAAHATNERPFAIERQGHPVVPHTEFEP